jgi:Mce-associated membrane protein
VLTIALVATVAGIVWLRVRDDAAEETQHSREEVMAQTEQFMLRMGTYGPEMLDDKGGMPEYREQVTEVITDKFAESFEKEAGAAEQLVAQAGVERSVEVFSSGVSTLDEDSARALVAGSFHDSFERGKKRIDSEPVPFRLEVDLVRVEGEWLVDDFSPVGATEGGSTGGGQ